MLQFISGVCLGPRIGYRTNGGNRFCSVVKKEGWGSWKEMLRAGVGLSSDRLLRREPKCSMDNWDVMGNTIPNELPWIQPSLGETPLKHNRCPNR